MVKVHVMGKHRGRRPNKFGSDLYKSTAKLGKGPRKVVDTSRMNVSDIPSRCPACRFYLNNALHAANGLLPRHKKNCKGCSAGSCRRTGAGHLVGCPNKDRSKVTGLARTWAKNTAEAMVAADKAAAVSAESAAASSAASSSSSSVVPASSEKRKRPRGAQRSMEVVPSVAPALDNGVLMLDTPLSTANRKFVSQKARRFESLKPILELLLRSRLRLGPHGVAVPTVQQPWPFRRGRFPLLWDSLAPTSLTSESEAEWALLEAKVYWLDFLRSHPYLQGSLRCVATCLAGSRRGSVCGGVQFARTGFDFDSTSILGVFYVKQFVGYDYVADMSMQCRTCGEKYTCLDLRILQQLPTSVQVCLPINVMEAEVGKRKNHMLVGRGLERLTAACVTRWQGFETVRSTFAEIDALHMLDREKAHASLLPNAAPSAAAAAAAPPAAAAAPPAAAVSSAGAADFKVEGGADAPLVTVAL